MATKRTMVTCVTAMIMALGIGCTSIVKYDLEDLSASRPDSQRQAMRVAVAPLQDMRPKEEKNPSQNIWKIETRDRMFRDGDVARGITEAVVKHFNHVHLFRTAEMVDKPVALPSADVLDAMKGLGYDALFTGSVKHFYGVGYPTAFDATATVLALIPITVPVTLPIMLIEDNKNEGFVELVDVQLTDTKTGEVLWSGTLPKKKEMKYFDADPVRAASETLREIADEIVKQIESMDMHGTKQAARQRVKE